MARQDFALFSYKSSSSPQNKLLNGLTFLIIIRNFLSELCIENSFLHYCRPDDFKKTEEPANKPADRLALIITTLKLHRLHE